MLIIPIPKPDIPDEYVDYLTINCNRILSEQAANRETDIHPVVEVPPITGWRRLLIKWRLKRQYWAECRSASA